MRCTPDLPTRAAPLLAPPLRATRACGRDQKALPRRGASARAARALSSLTRVDSCRNATKRATLGRPAGAVRARGVVRHGARMRWAPGRLARRAGVRPGMNSVAAAARTHRTKSGRAAVHAGGAQLAPGASGNSGAVARSGARRGALARSGRAYIGVSGASFRQRQTRRRWCFGCADVGFCGVRKR